MPDQRQTRAVFRRMNYVDFTLVRLADEALRAALFDQDALEQLTFAAYDADAMALGPPYSAIFDDVVAGVSMPRRSTAEAIWDLSSGGDRREGRAILFGLGSDPRIRVDALWRGALVAQSSSPLSRIVRVVSAWSNSGGIDAEIVRALGALPADPAALEAERRARLMTRLRAGFQEPDALTDAAFDEWLRQLGAITVGELLTRYADRLATASLQVQFSAPADAPPTARRLPLSAAILIRDQPLELAQLLADSKLVRDQLDDLGVTHTSESDSVTRHPVLVIWMIPDVTFDDKDWPGGESAPSDSVANQLRRQVAGRWLAREGIGLVTTPVHTAQS